MTYQELVTTTEPAGRLDALFAKAAEAAAAEGGMKTPEGRAAADAFLRAFLGSIGDRSLQAHYQAMVRERRARMFSPHPDPRRPGRGAPAHHNVATVDGGSMRHLVDVCMRFAREDPAWTASGPVKVLPGRGTNLGIIYRLRLTRIPDERGRRIDMRAAPPPISDGDEGRE